MKLDWIKCIFCLFIFLYRTYSDVQFVAANRIFDFIICNIILGVQFILNAYKYSQTCIYRTLKEHEYVPFMSGLPFIYRLKLYALFIFEKTEISIYRQWFDILHFKTGLAYIVVIKQTLQINMWSQTLIQYFCFI